MRVPLLLSLLALTPAPALVAQGLREVPQRFAYVQPIGLALGVGQVGIEFPLTRTSSIEVGGVGVYTREDGIEIFGGGPGIGFRQYLGSGQHAGFVVGGRVDGVWLRGDNRDATIEFLGGTLRETDSSLYLGLGILMGYRFISRGGILLEPMVGYEYFGGDRPLVPGSRNLQEELGFSVGLGVGFAW